MQIEVHAINESVALKIFDFLSAYLQSKNGPTYTKSTRINIGPVRPLDQSSNAINVLFVNMPNYQFKSSMVDDYDLVIFSNTDEPLSVSTAAIDSNLKKENCYLVANSTLDKTHELYDSVIGSFYDILLCNQYWGTPAYPQYYANQEFFKTVQRDSSIIFINGANRSWRQHLIELFKVNNVRIPIHSTISNIVHETNNAPRESREDKEFRRKINDMYSVVRNTPTTYYSDAVEIGIDSYMVAEGVENKITKVAPGYFIMPEYFKYQCVVFPDSTWQNNEVTVTEKALKCFYTQSIPWPVGGANIHKLYNQLGFKTAWNLLPKEFQIFDSVLDHFDRYQQMVTAIKWLTENYEIFNSDAAENLRQKNREHFLDNDLWKLTAESLLAKIQKVTK